MLVVGVVILIIILILYAIYENNDRKKNPEKWIKIDAENEERRVLRKIKAEEKKKQREELYKEAQRELKIQEEKHRPEVARKFFDKYLTEYKKIPNSRWIVMSREEKSMVFRGRERVQEEFYDLPLKTRELIKNKYKIRNSSFSI